MSKKSNINVLNKMTKEELKEAISEYTGTYRTYQRLMAMKLIIDGNTHKKVAETIGVTYATVNRWAKKCEKEGIDGLIPKFGGGRPSYLTDEQKEELDQLIQNQTNLTHKDLHKIIKRKYKVDYSMKQIGVLRKQLNYNYPRRYPIFNKSPPEAEDEIKKIKESNIQPNEIISSFDGATNVSSPYTIRFLCKKGTKPKTTVNAERFKVNMLGTITINGRSTLTITKSSTAPEVAIAIMKHRLENTELVK